MDLGFYLYRVSLLFGIVISTFYFIFIILLFVLILDYSNVLLQQQNS